MPDAVAPMPDNPVPEVYVLWHPSCAFGDRAADAIYAWLRPGNGLGPGVFYRCLPAPGAPEGDLPLPLPYEMRGQTHAHSTAVNLQIVLPLIDENMIADPAWRYWLNELGSPCASRRIIPIALDSTAFNAPTAIRERNFLRPTGDDPDHRVRSLLKQLTEALCNLLLGKRKPPGAGPSSVDELGSKIKVFLSHAKADGTAPARRVRNYIYSQTQIAAFFDENDIPFGSAFARVLERDIASDLTIALIAFRSAAYAQRPWCRRELSMFRRPIPLPDGANRNRWRLNPVLVVDALEGGSTTGGIPELGNSPILRWDPAIPGQEEQIVTMILRDALLSEFHVAAGRSKAADAHNIVINWLPDPTSILPIVQERWNEEVTIHHPGRSLSGLELDTLVEMFPRTEFRSFEGL